MKNDFSRAALPVPAGGAGAGHGHDGFAASDHNIGDIVTFAGYDWYIIGTESEGVTAPEGCYTLFAKTMTSALPRSGREPIRRTVRRITTRTATCKKDGGNRKRIFHRGQG